MPPFQSRSTGASRIARISSAGVIRTVPSREAERLTHLGVTGIDLALRGNTPPPSEIREVS